MNEPLVSVVMITYNHEKFIAQAIEGVLMQNGDLDIELIIADDASSDSTKLVIEAFLENHPQKDKVKYFRPPQNKGAMANFIFATKQCLGKYIALCEGDDYWTDPLKLQKQVDFLEQHEDFSLCSHNTCVLTDNRRDDFSKYRLKNYTESHEVLVEDVMSSDVCLLHTATLCFRNYKDLIPDWFVNCAYGDLPLICILGTKGKIWYDKEQSSIYRKHEGGITNFIFSKGYLEKLQNVFLLMSNGLDQKYKKSILIGYRGIAFRYLLDNFKNEPSFIKRITLWIKVFWMHNHHYSTTKRDLLYLAKVSFFKRAS